MICIQPDGQFPNTPSADPKRLESRIRVFFWITFDFLFVHHPLEKTMKKALLITSLLAAVALSACGKKEEAPVAAPAPAAVPAAAEPAAAAAPAAPADAAAAPAAAPAAPAADAAPAAPAAPKQ
jgi:hypothetical protein